jgi:hypothetical protein
MGKRVISVLFVVTLVALILFGFLYTDKPTKSFEITSRKTRLKNWHKNVTQFVTRTGRLPESLFELGLFSDLRIPPFSESQYDESTNQKLHDPEFFNQFTEYGVIRFLNGCGIIELKSSSRITYRLMIDDKGQIYKIMPIE